MTLLKKLVVMALVMSGLFAEAKKEADPKQALYEAALQMSEVKNPRREMGAHISELRSVSCLWRNTEPISHVRCDYMTDKEDPRKKIGPEAEALLAKIESVQRIDSDCGMGTCMFRIPQDVLCRKIDDSNTYDCHLDSVIGASTLAPVATTKASEKAKGHQ